MPRRSEDGPRARIERLRRGQAGPSLDEQAELLERLRGEVTRVLNEAVDYHREQAEEGYFSPMAAATTLLALRQVAAAVDSVTVAELALAYRARGTSGGWTTLGRLLNLSRETVRKRVGDDLEKVQRRADQALSALSEMSGGQLYIPDWWVGEYEKRMGRPRGSRARRKT